MTKARLPSRTVSKSTRYTLLTPFTLMQRTHHTNTKVMAKKLKRKNKTPQKKEEYCMHYLTTCENTINEIQCVAINTIKIKYCKHL